MTPGFGIQDGKKSESGTNIPDNFFESLDTILRVKIPKFFDADPDPGSGILMILDPGSGIFIILDPGWKNLDPGSTIRDKHPATLVTV